MDISHYPPEFRLNFHISRISRMLYAKNPARIEQDDMLN